MCDISEITLELLQHGVPHERVHLLAAKLIVIGEKAALYRATKGVVSEDHSIAETERVMFAIAGRAA